MVGYFWDFCCEYTELALSMYAVVGQFFVLWLTWRMIKFSWRYGKLWGSAFIIFFVAMFICLLRRITTVMWTLGYDGHFKQVVLWYDRYISNGVLTTMYLVFLIILVIWWKEFFRQYHARFE